MNNKTKMRKRKTTTKMLASLSLAFLAFSINFAHAQENIASSQLQPPSQDSFSIANPEPSSNPVPALGNTASSQSQSQNQPQYQDPVSIINPEANVNSDGSVAIKFTAKNSTNDFYSDLTWEFMLYQGGIMKVVTNSEGKPVTEGNPSRLIEYQISGDSFNLAPDQEKNFSSTFALNNLILANSQDYSFRIKVINRSDLNKMGDWMNSGLELGQGTIPINFNGAKLIWHGQEYQPMEGINVEAGEPLVGKIRLVNNTDKEQKIKANISVFERLATQKKVLDKNTDWYTVPTGGVSIIDVNLPNEKNLKPESYLAELRFFSEGGKQYTPLTSFRWVVAGVTGNIINMSSEKNYYKKGESLNLAATITGPADYQTEAKLDLVADFYDLKNAQSATFSQKIEFKLGDDAKKIDFSSEKYPRSENISKIILTLKDGGTILDTKELKFEKTANMNASTKRIATLVMVIILLIATTFLIYTLVKKRRTGGLLLIFTIGLLTLCVHQVYAIQCESNNAGYFTDVTISNVSFTANSSNTVRLYGLFGIAKCWNAANWVWNVYYILCTGGGVKYVGVGTDWGDTCATGAGDSTGCHWWYGQDEDIKIVDFGGRWSNASLDSITINCSMGGGSETRYYKYNLLQACLGCPGGFSVSCNPLGTQVTIDWNDLSGAVGYMNRFNKEPFNDWANVPAGDFSADTVASVGTFNITPGVNYQYSVQGKASGEVYPFSGPQCGGSFNCAPVNPGVKTFTIRSQAVCPVGQTVSPSFLTRQWGVVYWPRTDFLASPAAGVHINNYSSNAFNQLIDIGMDDNTAIGNLPLAGSSPHPAITYGNYFGAPGANWNRDVLPEGTYDINFQAPASACLSNFNLNVIKPGTGTGTVFSDIAGINCGADCVEPYVQGTVVTLSAIASSGSTFTGWSGCDSVSGALPNQTCTVTINSARTVSATFTACVPNCDCAASICVGRTCRNSCGTGDCPGTVNPVPRNDCTPISNGSCTGLPCGSVASGSVNCVRSDTSGFNCMNTTIEPLSVCGGCAAEISAGTVQCAPCVGGWKEVQP
jgi:hypothetical protein